MASEALSPEELFEQKMRSLTKSVIKAGKLKTRRRVGQRMRKRDKLLHRVKGEWAPNSVFIDNEKVIVQDLEHPDGAHRTEIMLAAIKHVLPVDDAPEFAVTWTRDGREERATATRPAKRQEEQPDGEFSFGFGGDSDEDGDDDGPGDLDPDSDPSPRARGRQDAVLVFRAASMEEARDWVTALNRAIQVSKSTHLTSSFSVLREYNTMGPGDGEAAAGAGGRRNRRRNKLVEAEALWARANREAKRLPRPMQTLGRTAAALAATGSVVMVAGLAKSLLKVGVAPSAMRRRSTELFQSVWVDAMAWLLPPMLFHLSGDVPSAVKPQLPAAAGGSKRRSKRLSSRSAASNGDEDDEEAGAADESDARAARRASRKRREQRAELQTLPPARLVVMNSACESDLLLVMLVAKAIEEAHGNVKGFVSSAERAQLLGMGSVFELFDFLFLQRKPGPDKQARDRAAVGRHLASLQRDRAYEWCVLFPERGWPSQAGVRKDQATADATGRPALQLLLLPNGNELEAALEALEGRPAEVFDLTLSFDGFSGELPRKERDHGKDAKVPSYANLLNGTAASDVHLNMKRFGAEEVRAHAGGAQAWLDERWARKDALLRHFAEYGAFPPDDGEESVARDAFSVDGSIAPMLAVWAFNVFFLIFAFIYLL